MQPPPGQRCGRRRDNVLHALMAREEGAARPGTHVHRNRRLYEHLPPEANLHGIETPEVLIRKFIDDGQLLICFSHCQQELVVFRYTGLNYCVPGDPPTPTGLHDLPPKASTFGGYFTHLYSSRILLSGTDILCKDFCVTLYPRPFLVLASSTRVEQGDESNTTMPTLPTIEMMSLHLVRIADGEVLDRMEFPTDLVHLSHNMAVSLHNGLIVLLSIRRQCVHFIQVSEDGTFKEVRQLGLNCREDDELCLRSAEQAEQRFLRHMEEQHELRARMESAARASTSERIFGHLRSASAAERPHSPSSVSRSGSGYTVHSYSSFSEEDGVAGAAWPAPHALGVRGMPSDHLAFRAGTGANMVRTPRPEEEEEEAAAQRANQLQWGPGGILTGLKQRLLVYLFKEARSQRKLKVFYANLPKYMDLIMTKVQMLDKTHLFIKYADMKQVALHLRAQRSNAALHHSVFFAVYSMEHARIEGFFSSHSEDLHKMFVHFAPHFSCTSDEPMWNRYMSTYGNDQHLREILQRRKHPSWQHGEAAYLCVGEDGETSTYTTATGTAGGTSSQMIQRVLAHLPLAPQSTSPSPFFDHALFQYDEKLIGSSERPKPCVEHPIKFLSRTRANKLRFKMDLGVPPPPPSEGRSKRIVYYIFHPVCPFALSVIVSFTQPQVVNLHMRL